MFPLRHTHRWIQLASFGLFGMVLALTPAFAGDVAQVVGLQASPVDDQIILNLSAPSPASLISPLEKGERRLLLDIPGASISSLSDKEALLQAVKSQLPDVAQVTLDEFRGSNPLVRLMIKTKDPGVTGALVQSKDGTLVLQLLKPHGTFSLDTKRTDEEKSVITLNQSPDASSSEPAPAPQEAGPQLQRKAFEADSLRRQRNKLEDQLQNLRALVEQQHATIDRLKEEQALLVKKDSNAREKAQIQALQRELKELKKSYDQMKRTLLDYQSELKTYNEDEQKPSSDKTASLLPSKTNPLSTEGDQGALLNTLADLSPNELNQLLSAEKDYRAGRTFEFQKEFKQAEAKYQSALTQAPQAKLYAMALSGLYARQRDFYKATSVLENSLKFHPEDTELLNELGKVALIQNNEADALNYFKKALPVSVLNNYATTLKRLNKMPDAESMYQIALAAHPSDGDLLFNLGTLYLNQKRFAEAEAKFSEAVKMNPGFAEARYHLALTYVQTGDTQRAIEEFNQYLQLMPGAPNYDAVKDYVTELQKSGSLK